jgi:hypothetical protein
MWAIFGGIVEEHAFEMKVSMLIVQYCDNNLLSQPEAS